MTSERSMKPVQPYLIMNADNYKRIHAGDLGISQFYEFMVENGGYGEFLAVPDGSTDLIFGISEKNVKVYIGGTVLKVKQWDFEEGRTYFGVRFEPGRCVLPKTLSVKEVVNADLEIDKKEYGTDLTDHIVQRKDLAERAEIFMQYYGKIKKQEAKKTVHNIESYMRKRIYESCGNVTIKALSEETGYSECYIRRSFEQVHGISPKVFERFVRFQNMLNSIGKNVNDQKLEELAMDCGYYDQSHMMKDFKSFAGTTPERYKGMVSTEKWNLVV